jgi:hypothetical protein
MSVASVVFQAIPLVIPAASGLVGVALGAILTSRNQRKERKERFIHDQLTEFYAPMLGIRERLRAKGEIRLKVSNAANAEWRRLMQEARGPGIDHLQKVREESWPKFERIIEHNNQQLKEELLPLYREMVDLFTAKMHFAESPTRQHFAALVEFVEMWDRWLRGALPAEVAERVGPNEENLKPLYTDLGENFERLQAALKE